MSRTSRISTLASPLFTTLTLMPFSVKPYSRLVGPRSSDTSIRICPRDNSRSHSKPIGRANTIEAIASSAPNIDGSPCPGYRSNGDYHVRAGCRATPFRPPGNAAPPPSGMEPPSKRSKPWSQQVAGNSTTLRRDRGGQRRASQVLIRSRNHEQRDVEFLRNRDGPLPLSPAVRQHVQQARPALDPPSMPAVVIGRSALLLKCHPLLAAPHGDDEPGYEP